MMDKLLKKWRQYRYRFVPWIVLNLKDRSVRSIPKGGVDKLIDDLTVQQTLILFFTQLHQSLTPNGGIFYNTTQQTSEVEPYKDKQELSNSIRGIQSEIHDGNQFHENTHSKGLQAPIYGSTNDTCGNLVQTDRTNKQFSSRDNSSEFLDAEMGRAIKRQYGNEQASEAGLDIMKKYLGFSIQRQLSRVPGAGTGVVVTSGFIPKATVVAMYPGTVYYPSEPILVQSIGNQFVFRCIDNILIDGNDKRISKLIYRSCCQRERVGGYFVGDMSWLTDHAVNPMAVGQYVNNQNKEYQANVSYQEYDVPEEFPFHLRQFIPNIYYSSCLDNFQTRMVRTVVLVSLRDIYEGEELFSTYFTMVH